MMYTYLPWALLFVWCFIFLYFPFYKSFSWFFLMNWFFFLNLRTIPKSLPHFFLNPLRIRKSFLVMTTTKTLHQRPHSLRYNNVLLLDHNISILFFYYHSPQRCNRLPFCRTYFVNSLVQRHHTNTRRLWNGLLWAWRFIIFDMEKWIQALLVVVHLWHWLQFSCTRPKNMVVHP